MLIGQNSTLLVRIKCKAERQKREREREKEKKEGSEGKREWRIVRER